MLLHKFNEICASRLHKFMVICGRGGIRTRVLTVSLAGFTISRAIRAHVSLPDRTQPYLAQPNQAAPYHIIIQTLPCLTSPSRTLPRPTSPYNNFNPALPYLTAPYPASPRQTVPSHINNSFPAKPSLARPCPTSPHQALPYNKTIPTLPYQSPPRLTAPRQTKPYHINNCNHALPNLTEPRLTMPHPTKPHHKKGQTPQCLPHTILYDFKPTVAKRAGIADTKHNTRRVQVFFDIALLYNIRLNI